LSWGCITAWVVAGAYAPELAGRSARSGDARKRSKSAPARAQRRCYPVGLQPTIRRERNLVAIVGSGGFTTGRSEAVDSRPQLAELRAGLFGGRRENRFYLHP